VKDGCGFANLVRTRVTVALFGCRQSKGWTQGERSRR
jgi:hypothetical protein